MTVLDDTRATSRASVRRRALELLPGAGASHSEYEKTVNELCEGEYPFDVLVAVLTELHRRSSDETGGLLAGLARTLQARLIEIERAARGERIAQTEEREPLRARVLHAIANGLTSPGDLAARLGVEPETVSRALGVLSREGLVGFGRDADDGRKRNYYLASPEDVPNDTEVVLTVAGGIERSEHDAYGTPAEGDRERDREAAQAAFERYVQAAIERAVADRRQDNALPAAIEQLQEVVATCVQAHAGEHELLARRELATTLRQANRTTEHAAQLRGFLAIARGRRRELGGELAMPALGHFNYERGRAIGGLANSTRILQAVRDLVAARQTFEQLADAEPTNPEWVTRRAWATYGIADILRQRTDIDRALRLAVSSAQTFDEVDDRYGLASSVFLVGFCLRLRGDFQRAETVLSHAQRLTEEHEFWRLNAECLTQLGEASRSRGELRAASELLSRAINAAATVDHAVTSAFAHSSMGALAYESQDVESAYGHLEAAQERFVAIRHRPGIALNLRRLALVGFKRDVQSGARTTQAVSDAFVRLTRAQGRYVRLASAAGVVSCKLGRVEILIEAGQSTEAECAGIAQWFEASEDRYSTVKLDPWMPTLMAHLAAVTGHVQFGEVAERLIRYADASRAERASANETTVQTLVGSAKLPRVVRKRPDRMGGEPRRQVGDADAAAVG